MALCRFRIPDTMYEQFKAHCDIQNKTVSELLLDFVATTLNGSVATSSRVATNPVATNKSVATSSQSSVATDKWIEFDPFTGEPINH